MIIRSHIVSLHIQSSKIQPWLRVLCDRYIYAGTGRYKAFRIGTSFLPGGLIMEDFIFKYHKQLLQKF